VLEVCTGPLALAAQLGEVDSMLRIGNMPAAAPATEQA